MYSTNRRKFLELFGCGCCGLVLTSCAQVPITERRQLRILSEAKINAQASAVYQQFKSKEKVSLKGSDFERIKSIGNRIEYAVAKYFENEKLEDPTKNFEWEYVVVENEKIVNAWCMPGGKIAVYRGMLDLVDNDDQLSIVMGHEIAHAVAKHSIERQSQAITLQLGSQIADIFLGGAINRTRNTVGGNTGLDIFRIGILNPFGRQQETEADYLGLIFSSLARYDIRQSVPFWKKMSEKNKGKEPPQFLSTHPSSTNRINNLSKWINEVIIKYPPLA